MNEKVLKLIQDPVLICISVTLMALVSAVVVANSRQGQNLEWGELLIIMAVAGTVLLVGVFLRYRSLEKREITRITEEHREELRARDAQVAAAHEQVEALRESNTKLTCRLESPPISVVTKRDYGRLIKEWNEAGSGHLLLYNIELQSFQTDEDIQRTWGNIGELTNIQSVVLLLPEAKVRRWERVVRIQENKFFADPKNRKFTVCVFNSEDVCTDITGSPSIGFALYRFGDNAGSGTLHDTAVVFIMSGPFSQLRDPLIPEDSTWWDYHHILKFYKDRGVVGNLDHTWRQCFDESRTRSVDRVVRDTRPLRPVGPAELFEQLGVTSQRRSELLHHFEDRRPLPGRPAQIRPDGEERRPFTIEYSNGEAVQGHCRGAEDQPKQSLIWIGGFTEKSGTKLPALFQRTFRDEELVQFFYEVSPPVEYVTLERYRQDMREVLRFVQRQRAVEPGQTVLIARSINGLLAALVAAEDEFLQQLAGLILVAPVFDVIEMIDNYRATREQRKAYVTVEKCWRVAPGYTADKWEDPENGWLEFFDHHVSLTLFADIIRHDPEEFSLERFKRAIGKVTQECPVYILSNSDDPITGSRRALDALAKAASGGGLILEENYRHIEIQSSHYTVIDRDQYPFAPRQEVRETRNALRSIFTQMGVATNDEQELAPANEPESQAPSVDDSVS